MAHEKSVLASFQQGETRLIFARRRDRTPGLHFLEEGAAEAERVWTKSELLCPVESCPTPELTTVNGGSRRRDHFRHLVGRYSHGAESLFHLEGKAQIAKWAAARLPDATVRMEEASNTDRERIADVMVTLADGSRIAIEIQYAAITPSAWKARHDSYAEQGIRDIWLFGHAGVQLRELTDGDVALTPTHEAVAAAGMPVLWFNPQELLVGSATTYVPVRKNSLEVLASETAGTFHASPLARFNLSFADGLTDTRLSTLIADTRRYEVWYDQEREMLDEAARVRDAAARARAEALRLRVEAAAAARARAVAEFLATDEAEAIKARFGGVWPQFLSHHRIDIGVPDEIWQARLFRGIINMTDTGGRVRRDLSGERLNTWFKLGLASAHAVRVVTDWFDVLADAGILESRYVTPKIGGRQVKVFHKLEWAGPREVGAVQLASLGQAFPAGRRTPPAETFTARSWTPPPTPKETPTGFVCAGCGKALDKMLASATKYHTGCNPVQVRWSR